MEGRKEGRKEERKEAFCGWKWGAETLDQSAGGKLIDFWSLDFFSPKYNGKIYFKLFSQNFIVKVSNTQKSSEIFTVELPSIIYHINS